MGELYLLLFNQVSISIVKTCFLPLSYLCLLFLSVSSTVSAETKSVDPEFKFAFALGAGIQYGLIFGAQFNLISDRHKVYVSVGFPALGGGYDYAVSKKTSVGLNFTRVALLFGEASITSVNVNYHFNSTFDRSWVLGFDIGRNRRVSSLSGESSSNLFAFVSVGYRF